MDTGTHGSARTAVPARGPARVRRAAPAPRSRPEQRLEAARERELRARRELALALARAEETYSLAVRRLEAFDDYLSGARRRLLQAGYLAPSLRGPGSTRLQADGESSGVASRRRRGGEWSGKARLRVAAAVALRSGH